MIYVKNVLKNFISFVLMFVVTYGGLFLFAFILNLFGVDTHYNRLFKSTKWLPQFVLFLLIALSAAFGVEHKRRRVEKKGGVEFTEKEWKKRAKLEKTIVFSLLGVIVAIPLLWEFVLDDQIK